MWAHAPAGGYSLRCHNGIAKRASFGFHRIHQAEFVNMTKFHVPFVVSHNMKPKITWCVIFQFDPGNYNMTHVCIT